MEVVPAVKEDGAMEPAVVPPPSDIGHRVNGLGGKPHVRSSHPERRGFGAIRYQQPRPEHCRRRGDGKSDSAHFFLLAIGSQREPAERTEVNATLKTLVPRERVDERDKNRRRSSPVHRLEHGRRHCLHDHRESTLRPLRVRAKLDRHAIDTVSMAVDVPSPVAEVISCHGS